MTFVLTAVRRSAALGLCAAAALVVPFGASPAAAAPDDAGALIFLTVTPHNGGAYSMRLTCDPDGGTHPQPQTACDALREVDGYIEGLDVDPGPCPYIFDPVGVEANGHWYGNPVSYAETFPNKCVMDRKLGPLVR
jgi:hypothetical protein